MGSHLYPSGLDSSSTYSAFLYALPNAMIEPWGGKIVGTKYLPPILPTLLIEKVPFAKSDATNFDSLALS